MRTGKPPQGAMRLNSLTLVGFIIVATLLVVPFYSARSSSSPTGSTSQSKSLKRVAALKATNSTISNKLSSPLFLPVPLSPEGISTVASDCTTPKTDFNLGDTVCAKASGVQPSLFPWHVSWTDPEGNIRQLDNASTDDTTTYTYVIPSSSTSIVNGDTLDNRGNWRVNLTRPNGALRQTASFAVHEPANPEADVFVQKFQRDGNDQVHTGDNVAFLIVVGNAGPDAAQNVHLTDTAPSGATLVSLTQNSGPTCVP